MGQSAQQCLDIAWRYQHQSLEFIAEKMQVSESTAAVYREAAEMGTVTCAELNEETYRAVCVRLTQGEPFTRLAPMMGYTHYALRRWFDSAEFKDPMTISLLALRLPFNRFGELQQMLKEAA